MIRDLHLCFLCKYLSFKIFVSIITAIQLYECCYSLAGELDELAKKKKRLSNHMT